MSLGITRNTPEWIKQPDVDFVATVAHKDFLSVVTYNLISLIVRAIDIDIVGERLYSCPDYGSNASRSRINTYYSPPCRRNVLSFENVLIPSPLRIDESRTLYEVSVESSTFFNVSSPLLLQLYFFVSRNKRIVKSTKLYKHSIITALFELLVKVEYPGSTCATTHIMKWGKSEEYLTTTIYSTLIKLVKYVFLT